jgi:hypothetical protein
MQTLVDPFELASEATPRAPIATEQTPGAGEAKKPPADPLVSRIPPSEAWQRVRCWCSEE